MRVEDDGHLTLHTFDLLAEYRDAPPALLNPQHFTREARICAWYAQQANALIRFAAPGRVEPIGGWGSS